jgi:hypothetical protein
MSKLDLARALAYKHLDCWLDKYKGGHSKQPKVDEYMMAMDILLKNGDAEKATIEECQAALILEEVLAIEASLECGTAKEVFEGETEPLLDILVKRLDAHVAKLEQLETKSLARKGAKSRSENYEPLRMMARDLVSARSFKSRRNAAKTIAPDIIAEGKKIGVVLSEDQAELTISKWLKDMCLPANI